MTAPERPASGLDANARGIIVLVVAVLVGIGLLVNVGNDSSSSSASPTSTTSGTTLDIDSTTTTVAGASDTTAAAGETTTTEATGDGEARDAAEVTVVVLNGSSKDNAASANSETIGSAGYQMGTPGNPVTNIEGNTVVYYAEGYQADAVAVAAVLGRSADAVQPKPAEDLGPGAADANVVVVLGAADTSPVN